MNSNANILHCLQLGLLVFIFLRNRQPELRSSFSIKFTEQAVQCLFGLLL